MRIIYCKNGRTANARLNVSKWLKGSYKKVQSHWVDYMNRLCAGLTLRGWKIALYTFVTICCTLSGWTIARTFLRDDKSQVSITHIQKLHTAPTAKSQNAATGVERERVLKLLFHLDSLQKTEKGKQQYDSLAKVRPGLIDSLNFLRRIY